MFRSKIMFVAGVLICVLAITFYYFSQHGATTYEDYQVKKTAPVVHNYLLNIDQHISLSTRPAENFNFPIPLGDHGPTTTLYSGNNQYPFYCMTLDSGLGQPMIDNQAGYGVPIYDSLEHKNKILGYSKDCSLPSTISYLSVDENKAIETYYPDVAANMTSLENNKKRVLFRIEQGTINRFIYTIIMPINADEVGNRLAKSAWNNRLIYQFNGGSGIGYRQGRQTAKRVLSRQIDQLLAGYAVISSTGNKTSYTYNMLLAEDTARRVKNQFVSLYGEPLYTVGVGGSGGGLAQYLIGQNSTGILDGLLPLYSYPDMITQTTYALDCDLLNNYFTFRAKKRSKWNDWSKRQLIEGMNALNNFPQRTGFLQPVNQLMAGFFPSMPEGNSECINGYFGLSSFINNPKQGFIRDFFHPDVVDATNWSFWQDLNEILGTDEQGFGLSTWDNVGVQYGLNALVENKITVTDFLDINKKIGSWKKQTDMKEESIVNILGMKIPLWLSLWGNQNITEVTNNAASRHQGSIAAMNAAYRSGQVFIGKVNLPIIDVRHYLENDLDMHHMSASFYSRLRIEQANGHSKNHVIWLSHKEHNPLNKAFEVMDEWVLKLKTDKNSNVVNAKPSMLDDACFDETGNVIAKGAGIFDGKWNDHSAQGACLDAYPMYSTSRIQAGGTWAGDVFKCALMSVSEAINKGMFGVHDMRQHQTLLEEIFPTGVCNYAAADLGRPNDI